MDSWLKKSHDNGISVLAGDVEAAVETNAYWVFANVFAFCNHWVWSAVCVLQFVQCFFAYLIK